jgi:hypothetical protein
MNIFLRASCGCIVLNFEPQPGWRIVVIPCDGNSEDWEFFPRDMSGKTFEPVPAGLQASYRKQLAAELANGARFRMMKDWFK